jgi:DNA-binding MarR family transcriptional regulator
MSSALDDEIQQTSSAGQEEEAYLGLERTADLLRAQVAGLLKEHELTPTQYNVLRILRGAGKSGHLTGEIGTRLVVHFPDVPRLLDRMEKRGLVQRRRESDDRRCVRVTLTRAGRELVDRLDAPIQALHIAQLAHLGGPRLRTLIRALGAIRANTASLPTSE